MNSEDSRNLILAIALSVLVLIGWKYFFAGPQLQKDHQAQTQAQTPAAPTAGAATPAVAPGVTPPAGPGPPRRVDAAPRRSRQARASRSTRRASAARST